MDSSRKDEIDDGGSLMNQANVRPFSVIAKALHLTGSWYSCSFIRFLYVLRWSTRSFVPLNVSILGILNFAGRGKCSTPAVNRDSVCCTKASMETGARPFIVSFLWLSSCWMSRKRCSHDRSPISC